MFNKVLIANRGAIACRIIRTLKQLGVRSVTVYSDADANSLHVAQADEAVGIGGTIAAESYLSFEKIFDAARRTGAQAIHPGYGFLSENAEFAEACAKEGFIFIGPTPKQMREFGLKHSARAIAQAHGVPMLPGSELLDSLADAKKEANRIGYPVMLKSTAGGGGIGMRMCADETALVEAYESVRRLAASAFKQNGVYLEKYVAIARHIEVQIFGDGKGNVVALGERDCSAQRRNQKVIEETPAPGLSDELRKSLLDSAVRLAKAIGYQSAGTVEFVFDVKELKFYFLEVNTRLQVEHGVTEEVTGIDLVEWMVKQAAGELDLSNFKARSCGASIQVRLYAEDPNKNFQPGAGVLTQVTFPAEARIETWVERGSEVPPFYDPMIAKIIVKAPTRAEAVDKLTKALANTRIAGIECNLEYLRQTVSTVEFANGNIHTKWLATFPYRPATIDVIEPGTQSSIQDYPGRVGYWAVGVPPSGPMDDFAFRIANELAGNDPSAAGLEMTLSGPTLKFNLDTTIALAGAEMEADLDGNAVPFWQSVHVRAGSVLRLRGVKNAGCRAYLAVRGGFDVPDYLGSKSTFGLGKFGGHAGRTLRHGDVLPVHRPPEPFAPHRIAPHSMVPGYSSHWQIAALYGPHAAPDFFTEQFINTFFSTDWKVHYNSSRTGIRLIGPKPEFARADGGDAGLHPSNIHDTEYAVGTINFTGDMPVILAKDGPSLGGFVCPATIIKAEFWKVGQLRPGDTIRFVRTTFDQALATERRQDSAIAALAEVSTPLTPQILVTNSDASKNPAIVHSIPGSAKSPGVVYRQAGDKYLLVEYGPLALDFALRFRVHTLMEWFKTHPVDGIIELSPGVRSLQVNFDGRVIPLKRLLEILDHAESELPSIESLEVPTRILRLPLAYDESGIRLTIEKYQQSVRPTAPWLPSNIEFIRRMNGLERVEQVRDTVYNASYLVLGLGDVYLGAPCAVPVDPRHRFVTTKYNPARTFTVENVVGIGGVYMCIYGMEGPGGYQLVGRTCQVWNTYRSTREFQPGKPWLLRFFDQVRFYPVSEKELLEFRQAFLHGRVQLDIREEVFSFAKYQKFLHDNEKSIGEFRTRQQKAFAEERDRWVADGSNNFAVADSAPEATDELAVPKNGKLVASPITGNVWAVLAKEGERINAGQKVIVVEAMKMEVGVEAPVSGIIKKIAVAPGKMVTAGQGLVIIEQE
ncbi:MAG TPA: urea carboxylase [Desulfuromonadaceae bacterium]|nr:urea carboxylase [Desulfuromonadaceae bacterium]